jgi:hypothetical protein
MCRRPSLMAQLCSSGGRRSAAGPVLGGRRIQPLWLGGAAGSPPGQRLFWRPIATDWVLQSHGEIRAEAPGFEPGRGFSPQPH